MALVTKLAAVRKANPKVHAPTECEWSTFEIGGTKYLQLDTFGSRTRQERGQISQSIQFDRKAIEQLRGILDELLKA